MRSQGNSIPRKERLLRMKKEVTGQLKSIEK
jgi:hypothetical protein